MTGKIRPAATVTRAKVLAAPATLPDRQPASALASSAAGEAYNKKATMFQPYP